MKYKQSLEDKGRSNAILYGTFYRTTSKFYKIAKYSRSIKKMRDKLSNILFWVLKSSLNSL
jgi:hypothetical protein